MYRRKPAAGFGNAGAASDAAPAPARPLKRPSQRRARFTVDAIYEAFVRIWRVRGWDGVTTRAVALEAGCSVGTLYEYFPNKEALLSGYVRHTIESMLARIDAEAVNAAGLDWATRIRRLVRLTCGADDAALEGFEHEMLMLEARIAETRHHRRVFDELCAAWQRTLAACPDLPRAPDAATVQSLLQAIWGARRYRLLLRAGESSRAAWVTQMERLCLLALGDAPPPGAVVTDRS
ncbi:TetR family transcriptional regulator [Cupriavidus sp. SK-3]|uniref:TetR/AcrR family transcriptional regulator n=1 Tax=Cupriavidus sp. SK-3 TaxID=1470558 RepID=UPI0004491352|nr:TetR/AcrR family transcriptional regulator [Cupriavidus sp. SK-3]KDP84361.1 TetR family transcriptional regulator [Cupriavidus sp. SK-3]